MNKYEFLARLYKGLSGLPQDEIEERLSFYGEMIDDLKEEGLSEEEAIAKIGTVEEIVSQVVAEIPFSKLVKERAKPTRKWQAWEIVLIAVGFPVWFPVFIALFASVFAVGFSLYASMWAVIVAMWAACLSLAVAAVGGVILSLVFLCVQNGVSAAVTFAASLVCAGLAILAFFGCKAITQGAGVFTQKIWLWVKKLFVKKEKRNE